MQFEEPQLGTGAVRWFGYLCGFLVATTFLFLALHFIKHSAVAWWFVALCVFGVTATARLLGWWLHG
jgi:hypothetical protein